MNLIPVKDHPDLAKDTTTGAIVNINRDKYLRQKKLQEQRKTQREELDTLKSDVQEIKMLLHKLLENGTNG